MEKKYKTGKEFIQYLDSLPNLDLTDPKVQREFCERMSKGDYGIEEKDRIWAKSAGKAFTMLVK